MRRVKLSVSISAGISLSHDLVPVLHDRFRRVENSNAESNLICWECTPKRIPKCDSRGLRVRRTAQLPGKISDALLEGFRDLVRLQVGYS